VENFSVEECRNLEQELGKGMSKIIASEEKMTRLESDLALIADQEKSIVTQLARKQKFKIVIENTADADFDYLLVIICLFLIYLLL
jgi:hypothetical protein